MIYEIDTYLGVAVDDDLIKKHEPIWTRIAKIKGFEGPIFVEGVPIYFDGVIPENQRGTLGNFLNDNRKNVVSNFMPTIFLVQAKNLEDELLRVGSYNVVETDFQFSKKGSLGANSLGIDVVRKTYSKSMFNKLLVGEGSNELEAICDAYINFYERKADYQRL